MGTYGDESKGSVERVDKSFYPGSRLVVIAAQDAAMENHNQAAEAEGEVLLQCDTAGVDVEGGGDGAGVGGASAEDATGGLDEKGSVFKKSTLLTYQYFTCVKPTKHRTKQKLLRSSPP